MKLSQYFLPVSKEVPAEANIVSHQMMLRCGMIKQTTAGIYSWLPLGFKVLKKIEDIVHDEQIKAGHIPMLMPTIQPAELWQESGRYDDYGKEMLRIKDRQDRNYLYGPTNEELITDIFRSNVSSYRDLPLTLYHIQWKFRDELRPRFGVMRGREFYMKDGYNFDLTEKEAINAYNRHFVSYLRTFNRMGLQAIPMRAETGPIGGNYSHEFLVLANTGESTVFFDKSLLDMDTGQGELDYHQNMVIGQIVERFTTPYARTEDTHDANLFLEVPEEDRIESKAIEVGQIFYFGTKYSEAMKAFVVNPDGKKVPVHMGSHGIGVSRLVGAIIEASHDEKGIIWPEPVAPFFAGLINLNYKDKECVRVCDEIYEKLGSNGVEILYDDTDERPGGKFAKMDLIGLPWQIVVGPKGLREGKIELVYRRTGKASLLTLERVLEKLSNAQKNSLRSSI